MFEGKDIVGIAMPHLNEKYVLGAKVPLANAQWKGPWDCAEFVSWCAYQAYKIVYAVRPANPATGESYSGWWYEDAGTVGNKVDVIKAIATPGAILVRRPNSSPSAKIGHVAISLGDGRTVEAKDRANGVTIVPNAASRSWQAGVFLPGILYEPDAAIGLHPYHQPAGMLFLDSPYMRGAKVLLVQQALAAKGILPGKLDGFFGPLTAAAVRSFQAQEGLVPDGVVGPQTAFALDLPWPLKTTRPAGPAPRPEELVATPIDAD